ncbi:MAG TPA: STN domain-containing protein [Pirellulales bacterium]|nr:STN domain-containing protein [Pirellulales bacterium]
MFRIAALTIVGSMLTSLSPARGDDQARPEGNRPDNEQRFEEALGQGATLDFDEVPLTALIEYFREATKLDIVLDSKALVDAGVGTDAPVSIHVSNASYKTALRLVLDQLDLTWVYRGEVVLVTSKTEAEGMLTTKFYDVRDLLEDPESPSRDFAALIDLISTCVAPTTWDEVGGPGAIKALKARRLRVLVISQTVEVHEKIASLLTELRSLAGSVGDRSAASKLRRGYGPTGRRRETRSARAYAAAPEWSVPRVHE